MSKIDCPNCASPMQIGKQCPICKYKDPATNHEPREQLTREDLRDATDRQADTATKQPQDYEYGGEGG